MNLLRALLLKLGIRKGWRFEMLEHHCRYDRNKVSPEMSSSPKRILFFAYLPYWLKICLPASAVLGAMGHTIELIFLPYDHYKKKDNWIDLWAQKCAYEKLESLKILNTSARCLETKPGVLSAEEEKEVVIQSKKDAIYVKRMDVYDDADERLKKLYEFRYQRNAVAMAQIMKILKERRHDCLLTANGDILEFGIAYRAAKLAGVPCTTFEYLFGRRCVLVSHADPVVRLNTDEAWREHNKKPAPPDVLEKAMALMAERAKPRDAKKYWLSQHSMPQSPEELRKKLQLAPDRKTALMCSNVIWDSAALGREVVFKGSGEWIHETVRWFSKNNDWQLIIRVHPDETIWGGDKPVSQLVRAALDGRTKNIILIDAADPTNTYSLMQLADAGIVYSTSAGMEMAVQGIPVVCAARAHYCGKGFTLDPKDPENYFRIFETRDWRTLKKNAEAARMTASHYYEFYFNTMPYHIPWDIIRLDEDLDEWPLSSVLSAEGRRLFRRTWDELTLVGHRS